MRKRIVITGLGVVCSAGKSVGEFGEAVAGGKQCFSRIDDPRLGHLRAKYAALVNRFRAEEHVHDEAVLKLDRFVHLAIAGARQALSDAAIEPGALACDMGLIFATCSGPMHSIENHYERIVAGNPAISAGELFAKKYYSGAVALCRVFGIEGISTTVTTACSASAGAVGVAADLIECGMLKAALVGGSDTFSPTTLAGFDGLKATCEGMCAPFSKPFGLNLGEGSAFMVMEDLDYALKRGATIHAELLGFGLSNDAYHCSAPDPSGRGQGLAMQRALARSQLSPGEIAYINAHGTGTAANDKAETKAVLRVFGEDAKAVAMSATKSIVGHCLGAAGCLEIIAGIVCAHKGVYPPTAGFGAAREGCTLDYVPDLNRRWTKHRVFMSNSFAFGGNNASVVMSAPRGEAAKDSSGMRAEKTEVCITGCGIVSPAGVGLDSMCAAVKAGGPLFAERAWGSVTCRAAAVPAFDERRIDRRLDLRNMDRPSRLATIAAKCALVESAFPSRPRELSELGFYLSISNPPSQPESDHIAALFRENFRLSQVQAFPYIVPNAIAGNVSRSLMLCGHNTVLCGGPGCGLAGVGLAAIAIQVGHVGACLSGAVDELSEPIVLDGVSAGAFDGVVPGEAAAVFMLESAEHAEARNALPLGWIRGAAFSSEARALGKGPSRAPLAATLCRALEMAGVAANDISLVCCRANCRQELEAVSSVVGPLDGKMVDVSPVLGVAESAQPLLSLAYVLGISRVECQGNTNYILCSFSSPQGANSAVVIDKGLQRA